MKLSFVSCGIFARRLTLLTSYSMKHDHRLHASFTVAFINSGNVRRSLSTFIFFMKKSECDLAVEENSMAFPVISH